MKILIFLGVIILFWLFCERGRILRASTKRFFLLSGIKSLFNLRLIHGYIYQRFTKEYLYVGIKYLLPLVRYSRLLSNWLTNGYHGKVVLLEEAKKIVNLNQKVEIFGLEKIIPYKRAKDLIINNPLEMVLYECPCRKRKKNFCKPVDVCLFIGNPFVDFILEHHPKNSRKITKDEALSILKEEHERGHFQSLWFKDVCLDRFYAICSCCKCCCGGVEAMVKYNIPVMTPSGYLPDIDIINCHRCGECIHICPFNALSLEDHRICLDRDRCMGCGLCEDRCPEKIINLRLDKDKGIPLDVDYLRNLSKLERV